MLYLQITPDAKKKESETPVEKKPEMVRTESEENPAESFFDLLSRCQSERMDEQRATLHSNKENRPKPKTTSTHKLQRSASSSNGKTARLVHLI